MKSLDSTKSLHHKINCQQSAHQHPPRFSKRLRHNSHKRPSLSYEHSTFLFAPSKQTLNSMKLPSHYLIKSIYFCTSRFSLASSYIFFSPATKDSIQIDANLEGMFLEYTLNIFFLLLSFPRNNFKFNYERLQIEM